MRADTQVRPYEPNPTDICRDWVCRGEPMCSPAFAFDEEVSERMSLEEVLRKAVERINSGSLTNEAQVKQAVILPILRALDWDDSDPAEFVPEFSVDNGRVDYALLRHGGGPLVFIEAKGLGGVDIKGEEQVFRYAVNRGVPFLILTDGNLWDFYLSMAAGDPPDRQFYRVELKNEERVIEYVEPFEKFLLKSRVVSEEA